MQRWQKVWRTVEELEEAITDAAEAHFGVGAEALVAFQSHLADLDDQLTSLHSLKLLVASCAVDLNRDAILWLPGLDLARTEFYRAVLEIWRTLGGELRRSTDGNSGPLARFFFAVVEPVMKEDQPSHSSLRDIVDTYKAWRDRVILSRAIIPWSGSADKCK